MDNEDANDVMHGKSQHRLRIHIDRRPHESANPTTGSNLYILGHIREGYELYREVFGDHEDKVVPNNDEKIHLSEDEHFYSAEHHEKEITIIVNTDPKHVFQRRLSFEQIVALANVSPTGGAIPSYAVTYEKGPRHKPDGTLVAGQSVKIRNGMEFDVTTTNRS